MPSENRIILLLLAILACGLTAAGKEAESGAPARAVYFSSPGESVPNGIAAIEGITIGSADDFWPQLIDALEHNRTAIIGDSERFPVENWGLLSAFLEEGGRAIFIGRSPLESRLQTHNDELVTREELEKQLRASANAVAGFSELSEWQHCRNHKPIESEPTPTRIIGSDWPAVSAFARDLDEADYLERRFASGTLEDGVALAFSARGTSTTTRLSLVCRESDGSHWQTVLTLSDQWQDFILHPQQFQYYWGGENRGGADDTLHLANADYLSIGLDMHLGPQMPGDHRYSLSEVRTVIDPRPANRLGWWPDWMLVSPPVRRYETFATSIVPMHGGEPIELNAVIGSPLPRALGTGGEAAAPYRWIPIYEALNAEGENVGWPVSIYVEPDEEGRIRKRWAWIGVDEATVSDEVLVALVETALEEIEKPAYLFKAGSPKFIYLPDEKIRVQATIIGDAPDATIAAKILDGESHIVTELVVHQHSIDELLPVPSYESAKDLTVELQLNPDSAAADTIRQQVLVLPLEVPNDDEWLQTANGYFVSDGEPVYLNGVNYWPRTTNGVLENEWHSHWLEPGIFSPELIEAELDRLARAGVNAIALQYHEKTQAPQLWFVAEQAQRRGIRIVAFIGFLQPIWQELNRGMALVDEARLDRFPTIAAIDLAWEPHLGDHDGRRRFDADWRDWLVEQFGSLEHACEVYDLWRDDDGLVTNPPDEELKTDGPHRARIALYRRFVDDWTSRKYGELKRLLRDRGVRQLLSARSGYGGTGNDWADPLMPIDLGAGAYHLDFISPENYMISGGLDKFLEGAFIVQYGRGVSGGKPVVWLEYGVSVGKQPMAGDLGNQQRYYANMHELLYQSASAGGFAWWFPSGWRVEESSDYGVIDYDGTWRPAGEEIGRFSKRLQDEGLRTIDDWDGSTFERFKNARGISALWEEHRSGALNQLEHNELEEMRPEGFGVSTSKGGFIGVGKVPLNAPMPIEGVNAEWDNILSNGRAVSHRYGAPVEVGTGEALSIELVNSSWRMWAAGDVSVHIVSPSNEASTISLSTEVAPLTATSVEFTADEIGEYRLRAALDGVGEFGQPLILKVADQSQIGTEPF
ncbi:hypothetical protein KQI84_16930 [bacterium]|nr:hypothetical protein [bacterium]